MLLDLVEEDQGSLRETVNTVPHRQHVQKLFGGSASLRHAEIFAAFEVDFKEEVEGGFTEMAHRRRLAGLPRATQDQRLTRRRIAPLSEFVINGSG